MIKLSNQLPKGVELGKVYSNPFARAFKPLKEEEDHEVSMGQNQLDTKYSISLLDLSILAASNTGS